MRAVLDNVCVGTGNAVNRYTVKAPVLAAISGADIDMARALLAQRAPDTPAGARIAAQCGPRQLPVGEPLRHAAFDDDTAHGLPAFGRLVPAHRPDSHRR